MSENISVFKNAFNNQPASSITWQDALNRIMSDRHKDLVEKGRSIKTKEEYSEFKKRFPGVTFGGEFVNVRNKQNITNPTGFIIPDIDSIQNVEHVFELLCQDEHIWFAFRSASGNGIKAGIRSKDVYSDEDHKRFFAAVERYFSIVYGIPIDTACKDICRLTFVSHDPDLFINPNPEYFDIDGWIEDPEPVFEYIPMRTDNNGWKAKYGRKVLESSCREIKNSVIGQKHHARLRYSRLVGGYIAGGYIDESEAMAAMEYAVKASQAKPFAPAMKTIRSGIEDGKKNPIYVEPKEGEDYFDIDALSKQSKQSKQGKQNETISSKVSRSKHGKHEETNYICQESSENTANIENVEIGTDDATHAHAHTREREKQITNNKSKDKGPAPQNLAAHIREWVVTESGSFTTEQLDREFCLTTRKEKNNRAKVLNFLINENLIKRDKQVKGKYHIIDSQIEFIDLDAANEEPFPIQLPFDLQNHVKIPKHSIIVLAGSSNAGKTALMLDTLKRNIKQQYEKHYYMSEMAAGEYKSRVMQFDMPLSEWKKVKAASRSYDFESAIQHYNPDGLTCIDYLEEVDGEYFKIASSIRDIYDALGDGCAMVAIQKKRGSEVAFGGEATAQKSRLYLVLDFLASREHSIVCALKVYKLKQPRGQKNLINHEMHFEIHGGSQFNVLMDWTPSSQVDRIRMAAQYESGREDLNAQDFAFKTIKGPVVVVKESDWRKWQQNFTNIDVPAELKRIATDTYKKPFVKYNGYFFQLMNLLRRKDEEQCTQ